jgi:hypothetical protein
MIDIDFFQEKGCHTVSDYQKEIKDLKDAIACKTAMCETAETELTHQAHVVNLQKDYISKLEDQHKAHLLEQLAWSRQGIELESEIKTLQEQRGMCQSIALLKQMQEETQRTAEILSSTLADERAAKRQRGV